MKTTSSETQVRDVEAIQGEMSRRMSAASDQMHLMEKLYRQANNSLVPRQEKQLALALIEANGVSRMLTADLHTVLKAHADLQDQLSAAQARADAAEKLVSLLPPTLAEHNRWLPGEKGRSGVYADDNCGGDFLRVFADSQGDVYFSMWGKGRTLDVRMVGSCSRRPHVLNAARRLAETLQQNNAQGAALVGEEAVSALTAAQADGAV